MSNIIPQDASANELQRVFRCIHLPPAGDVLGAEVWVVRTTRFFADLFSRSVNAYGMIRYYQDSDVGLASTPAIDLAGGHYESIDPDERGIPNNIVFVYNHNSMRLTFGLYELHPDSAGDVQIFNQFHNTVQGYLDMMNVPINVDTLYSLDIRDQLSDGSDPGINHGQQGPLYMLLAQQQGLQHYPNIANTGVMLPPGIGYSDLQFNLYGVWMFTLALAADIDPSVLLFSEGPPDFPWMPDAFIGGDPITLNIGTLFSMDNMPYSVVQAPTMNHLNLIGTGFGINMTGIGVAPDGYFLSGDVPTVVSDEDYEELEDALGAAHPSQAQQNVLEYHGSNNNF